MELRIDEIFRVNRSSEENYYEILIIIYSRKEITR